MVEYPADQGTDHCPRVAEQQRLHAIVQRTLPGTLHQTKKQGQHRHKERQSHPPHRLGDDQVEHADPQVEIEVGRACKANPKERVTADQNQRILVLAKTHLGRQVLAGKPFQQPGHIFLGHRQQQQTEQANDSQQNQPTVLEGRQQRQRRGQPQQRRSAVGQIEGQHRSQPHHQRQPAWQQRTAGDQLGQQQRSHQNHHPPQHIGVDRSADRPQGAVGVILDKTQRTQAPRIVETRQLIQNPDRSLLGQQIKQHRHRGRTPSRQQHPAGNPERLCCAAHRVDHHKKQRNPDQDLQKTTQQKGIGRAVGQPQDKTEKRHQQKKQHRQAERRRHKFFLPADNPLEQPDKKKRTQRHI